MANTKTATKRARQALNRQERNQIVRSSTRTALKKAVEAIQTKDASKAKDAYTNAIKALSKAASKGAIPKGRAARKISRLTLLAKKVTPAAVSPSKAK
jgi:small subunit ribosomal protein S20